MNTLRKDEQDLGSLMVKSEMESRLNNRGRIAIIMSVCAVMILCAVTFCDGWFVLGAVGLSAVLTYESEVFRGSRYTVYGWRDPSRSVMVYAGAKTPHKELPDLVFRVFTVGVLGEPCITVFEPEVKHPVWGRVVVHRRRMTAYASDQSRFVESETVTGLMEEMLEVLRDPLRVA